MCGICGYIGKNRITDEELVSMRDTMIHRGPNDAGLFQDMIGDRYIGLAHRRLSIFDLSESGHQPMITDDGEICVVFNGEIYNFIDLREELQKEGYSFKSNSDTEVILYSYDKWREACFSRFNGMFAIAIFVKSKDKLILARDRMGVKPLYFYLNDLNGELVFGSELKPIMKYPMFKKDIRQEIIASYLCNKYIASPDTIFVNTYKVTPGTYIEYTDGNVSQTVYWDILKIKEDKSRDLSNNLIKSKDELNAILIDAVKKRLAADVPVGTFLSSGIDSAIITAIAQSVSNEKVRTFTIGFYEKERNEADRAERIAQYLGTEHTQLYIGEKEIFNMLDGIADYYDEPFADASQLPMMLVSKLASDSVTVALSGDGGDELFCGYTMYDWVFAAQKLDFVGKTLYCIPGMRNFEFQSVPEFHAFVNNRDNGLKTQLFETMKEDLARRILRRSGISPRYECERKMNYSNWQERRMLLDMMTYLPDEIMTKTDRASMKYSLEVRSPLLDYRVVEKSFSIPQKFKYKDFDKKHILKELAYEYIPKKYLEGPKMGFGVPLAKWLNGPLKDEVKRYAENEYLVRQGIFNPEGIGELVEKQARSRKVYYSSMLWSFYVFQRWWEKYII